MNDDLVMRLRRWYSTYPANYDKELLREAADALERRTEERATVSPLDKVLVDARYELTRWKMGAPPDQARLQLLIERITEQSPYRGDGGPHSP